MENATTIKTKIPEMQSEAPEMEPQRQFYYMDLAKQLVQERAAASGRPLTFHVETFGCPIV